MLSPLWDSKGTSDTYGKEAFKWIISSDLLPVNDSYTPTFLHPLLVTFPFLPPLLLLGSASGLKLSSPINSTNCPSFSALLL